MPIFEVDHGQPVLARHLTPAASAFGVESAALVADHLGALLGEQLMPVASRQPGVDSPHLLAVDASVSRSSSRSSIDWTAKRCCEP